ncbi:hypothetical protein [Psychromicrobium sp. YIM B11713]|uniref:GH39 family glycosyl hydrolase n=1 Tax=Psychromicrobium sp. YIM B11713 TaxID=3145233 RepID=UPI00374ED9B1
MEINRRSFITASGTAIAITATGVTSVMNPTIASAAGPLQINFSAIPTTASNKGVENLSIGENKFLNQANGSSVSLAPGLPDLQDQFAQLGIADLRAHDWFGVADIDSWYNPNDQPPNQITNNAPDEKKEELKKFAQEFFNKRVIVLNAARYLEGKDSNPRFNWEPTDRYLRDTLNNPYYKNSSKQAPNILFRIGRLLDGGRAIPKNIDKYVELVQAVVRRYSVDWKTSGAKLPAPITEYEIWNEPDLGLFWSVPGKNDIERTAQSYYEFYSAVAKGIKNIAPNVHVGGCGAANAFGNNSYVDSFLKELNSKKIPLDFFSYHFYADSTADPRSIKDVQGYVRKALDNNGFKNAKTYVSEWNLTAYGSAENNVKNQSLYNSAFIIGFLICAEQAGVDKAYYYRADGAEFGLFGDDSEVSPGKKRFATYAAQAFWLYNSFVLQRKKSIVLKTDTTKTGIITTAAINEKGDVISILITNFEPNTNLVGDKNKDKLPPGTTKTPQHYIDSNTPANSLPSIYYGGVDGSGLKADNYYGSDVPPGPYAQTGELTSSKLDFSSSGKGYNVIVDSIPSGYSKSTVIAKNIKSGGQLNSLDGEEVVVHKAIPIGKDRTINFFDDKFSSPYSVLITIQLLK